MIRRGVVLVLLAAASHARPMMLRVDSVIAAARLVAEVTVVRVERADWLGRGRGGKIRVRVTNDPRRIHRGAAQLGKELDLVPWQGGAMTTTAELAGLVGRATPLLIVVDAQDHVTLAGERREGAYRVHGWCDHNACLLHCDDSKLGTRVGKGGFVEQVDLLVGGLRQRFGDETRAFWAKVAPLLCGAAEPLPDDELASLVAELGVAEPGRRDRAQRLLTERARYSVEALRVASGRATTPEVRRRIREVLDSLADYARAMEVAELVAQEARASVVRDALPLLQGKTRATAERWLEKHRD